MHQHVQITYKCCIYVASLRCTLLHATHAMHAMEEIRRNMTIYARGALYASHGHVPVSNRRRHLASFATSSLLFLLALCMNFDEMPLTRTYSLAALDVFDNHGYAPPIPCSVSCDIVPSKTTVANVGKPFALTALDVFDNHGYAPLIPSSVSCDIVPSKTTIANVGKPFVKPPTVGKPFVKLPTIPFDRMSFIRKFSPLGPSHRDNFPTLSVPPPSKKHSNSKPKLNLYKKTLIFNWGRRSPGHREFSKKYASQRRVSKKRSPKKHVTTDSAM